MKKNYILTLLIVLVSAYCAHCQIIVPNGNFETWQNVGAIDEEPTSWNGNQTGSGFASLHPQTCFREETNPHSGSYCLRLDNDSFFGTPAQAQATTGKIHYPSTNSADNYISTVTLDPDFNSPFVGRPDSLVGWFRFNQGGTDIGEINAYLHDSTDFSVPDQGGAASFEIAVAQFNTPSSNVVGWTRFSMPFSYSTGPIGNAIPTHLLLICSASNNAASANSFTILWIDDLEVIYCTPTTSTINVSECDSYSSPSGKVWTSSNTYIDTIPNAANCDSIITINLTINNVSDLTTSTFGVTISANNTGATYQWLDCDNNNSIIMSETSQSYTATANGNYAVELTENGCVDTTACTAITTVGILESNFGNEFKFYPNPTDGNFSIDLGHNHNSIIVKMTDLNGKLIHSKQYNNSHLLKLKIDEPAGIYLLFIESSNKKAVIRLVKE